MTRETILRKALEMDYDGFVSLIRHELECCCSTGLEERNYDL